MLIDLKSLWEFWISSEEDLWEYTSFNKLFKWSIFSIYSNPNKSKSCRLFRCQTPSDLCFINCTTHLTSASLTISPEAFRETCSIGWMRMDSLAYSTYFLEINVISGTVSNWRQLGFPLTNKLTYFRLLWNSTLKLKSTLDWTLWTSLHIYATTFWLAFILMNIDLLYDQCDENCGTCNF